MEGTFYVFRRGKAEVILEHDEDPELAETHVCFLGPGDGVGELGLLLKTKRTATVRALGPCEVFAISPKGYQTAVELLPKAARRGELVTTMNKLWALVTGPGGSNRPTVDYKVYLELSTSLSKTLTRAADMEDYDEDQVWATAQDDWAADCKRWNLKVTDTMDKPTFMCAVDLVCSLV